MKNFNEITDTGWINYIEWSVYVDQNSFVFVANEVNFTMIWQKCMRVCLVKCCWNKFLISLFILFFLVLNVNDHMTIKWHSFYKDVSDFELNTLFSWLTVCKETGLKTCVTFTIRKLRGRNAKKLINEKFIKTEDYF